jgi:hypothetical protein
MKPMYIFDHISLNFPYNEKTFSRKLGEKIKTHVLYPITFFFENHAVYGIMWKILYSQTGHR